MEEHVLSAIVDQVPQEHLPKLHQLVEQRLNWQSVYVIDPDMWCFEDAIEDSVSETLSEIGKFSHDALDKWVETYKEEWPKRFHQYDYNDVLGDYACSSVQEDIREAFLKEAVHDLHKDLILKHYGVK